MPQRRKRPPEEGALVRKLDPKLRVIANGGRIVNQIRSERSAAVKTLKVDPKLARLREPDDAPAPSDLIEQLPAKAWEAPEGASEDVVVDLFLTLSEAKAARRKAGWKGARVTRTRDNLVTVETPLASLSRIAGDRKVNAIELAERVDFSPPLQVRIASVSDSPGERIATSVVHRGGRGVLIGIVDVGGFDFAHPDFLTASGRTRFHAIWDQAGSTRPPPKDFGYGACIRREHMDRALAYAKRTKTSLPATELEPQSLRMRSSHATHVASIAAGNHGVCPNAVLAGVSLALPREDTDRRKSFYDSTRLAHAIDFLFDLGDELGLPVSVNVSLGTNGHAHDGTSALSRWLDHALSTPGRSVAVAAGNAGRLAPLTRGDLGFLEGRIHTSGRLSAAGLSRNLEWIVVGNGKGDLSENEIEIWYGMQDRFAVEIKPPSSAGWIGPVEPGEFIENRVLESGTVLSVFNELYSPSNGHNLISCFLSPFFSREGVVGVEAGVWTLRLHGRDVRDGSYHAWIERDDPRRFRAVGAESGWAFPSFFSRATAIDTHTVNSLASGDSVIAVANLDFAAERIHLSSSPGPTRDGRLKPDIAAPGTSVIGANGFDVPSRPWVRMTGTSMASPYVAGVVGLMLEIEPRLTAAQIEGVLRRSARPLPGVDYRWQDDAGFGAIDPDLCLREVAALNERGDRTLGYG
jgi:subtilisin family serine protease